MGTNAAVEYARLESALIAGRRAGTLTADEDDEILEQMDRLWFQMTTVERVAAYRRTPALNASHK